MPASSLTMRAARYFVKTECFCFTPQHFAQDEERETRRALRWMRELPANMTCRLCAYAFYDLAGERAGFREKLMAQAGHTHDTSEYSSRTAAGCQFFGSVSLFLLLLMGFATLLNGAAIGGWIFGLGFVLLFTLFFLWLAR